MARIKDMTLREKIGQLLMVRNGALMLKPEGNQYVKRSRAEVAEILKKYPYGSIYSSGFTNNYVDNMYMDARRQEDKCTIAQHKEWVDFLNENLKVPLLVGVDCENGAADLFADGTATVSGFSVGAANSEQLAYDLGVGVAKEIKSAGCNWRWTPIVDIYARFDMSLGRAFSTDPEQIVTLSTAAVKGVESVDVAATIKHFPGADPYGYRDDHMAITHLLSSLPEWEENQGKVFKQMIENGVSTIMISHGGFPAVDDEIVGGYYIPATCSEKIIKGLLREKLGFEGVVITDGIGMGALKVVGTYEERLIRMINAGNDVILGVMPEDLDFVEQAVMDGRIPVQRIEESFERVMALKEKLGLLEEEKPMEDFADIQAKTIAVNTQIAEKSITLLYDKNKLFPLSKEKIRKVAMLCSSHQENFDEKLQVLVDEFKKRGAEVTIFGKTELEMQLAQIAEENDLILYVARVSMHNPVGFPTLFGDVAKCYFSAFGYGAEKSVGISLGYPHIHFDIMTGAPTFINAYSVSPDVQTAVVRAMYGEIPFEGVSPTDIEPKLRYVYC